MANYLTTEKKQTILDAVKQHPDNMKQAAESAQIPYGTFIGRAKTLGVYRPNPGQQERKRRIAQNKLWNEASNKERRRRVLKEQDNKCDMCGIREWNGEPLVLELDHIDGDTSNNNRTNLRFLCPNCHSLTPTHRNKKRTKKKYVPVTDEKLIQSLKENTSIRASLLSVGLVGKGGNYNRAKRLLKQMGE